MQRGSRRKDYQHASGGLAAVLCYTALFYSVLFYSVLCYSIFYFTLLFHSILYNSLSLLLSEIRNHDSNVKEQHSSQGLQDRDDAQTSELPHSTQGSIQHSATDTTPFILNKLSVGLWVEGLTVPFMMPMMDVTSSARKSVCREWMIGTPPQTAASKLKLRIIGGRKIGLLGQHLVDSKLYK